MFFGLCPTRKFESFVPFLQRTILRLVVDLLPNKLHVCNIASSPTCYLAGNPIQTFNGMEVQNVNHKIFSYNGSKGCAKEDVRRARIASESSVNSKVQSLFARSLQIPNGSILVMRDIYLVEKNRLLSLKS